MKKAISKINVVFLLFLHSFIPVIDFVKRKMFSAKILRRRNTGKIINGFQFVGFYSSPLFILILNHLLNKLIYAIIFTALVYYNGCKDNNPIIPPTTSNNTFAIYFLKDTTLTIKDILSTNLEDLVLADKPWLSQDDIDFYDWSSHCIYLKKDKSYFFPDFDKFDYESLTNMSWIDKPLIIVANNKKCYASYFLGVFSNDMWPYPDIFDFNIIYYPVDIIYFEWPFPFAKDIRKNENVRNTLIDLKLLHEGLLISVDSIWIDNADTTTVKYKITINNEDTDNLYVLDPNKMESELFHYFTNGPVFYNITNNKTYESVYKRTIKPIPPDYYDYNWFTKIECGKSITRMITLKGYSYLPNGNYYCIFNFNNPNNVSKKDRLLVDGRYWLGSTISELIGFNWIDSGKISLQAVTSTKVQKAEFIKQTLRR